VVHVKVYAQLNQSLMNNKKRVLYSSTFFI